MCCRVALREMPWRGGNVLICVFSRYKTSSLEGGEGIVLKGEALITMLLGVITIKWGDVKDVFFADITFTGMENCKYITKYVQNIGINKQNQPKKKQNPQPILRSLQKLPNFLCKKLRYLKAIISSSRSGSLSWHHPSISKLPSSAASYWGFPVGVKPRDLYTNRTYKKFNPKHISHLQERWDMLCDRNLFVTHEIKRIRVQICAAQSKRWMNEPKKTPWRSSFHLNTPQNSGVFQRSQHMIRTSPILNCSSILGGSSQLVSG